MSTRGTVDESSDGDRRGNGDADGDNNSIPDDADISNDPSPKISLKAIQA